ncbi:MAG: hypothetical protein IJS88_04395 [Alphaproteobacteria bacterium]|nr:hypothetical protein [Alphaproteobacteria bacterium]
MKYRLNIELKKNNCDSKGDCNRLYIELKKNNCDSKGDCRGLNVRIEDYFN